MKRELIAQTNPKSPISEIFRTLRTNIQFMSSKKELKSILITSTQPDEGKSWTASNLAVTFAQTGKRVVIVDADMRKGRQFKIFKLALKPGLSNYLSGIDINDEKNDSINLEDYMQETGVENLKVITSGNIPPNPSELLVSENMNKLLEDLKDIADIVIIDGTPSELVTDSIILSRVVDATLIVVSHKQTKKDSLNKVIKNIQNVNGNLIGIVLNKIPVNAKKYAEKYYYREKTESDNKRKKVLKTIGDIYSDVKNKNDQIDNLIKENSKLKESLKEDIVKEPADVIGVEEIKVEVKEELDRSVDEKKAKKATTTKATVKKTTATKKATTTKSSVKKTTKTPVKTKKTVVSNKDEMKNDLKIAKKQVSSDVKKNIIEEIKEYKEKDTKEN